MTRPWQRGRGPFKRVVSDWPCWLLGHDWRLVLVEQAIADEVECPWGVRRVWWCGRCPETYRGEWMRTGGWDGREAFNRYAKLPRVIE